MYWLASAQAASPIVFTSTRNSNKAVQAVHVMAAPPLFPPPLPSQPDGSAGDESSASSSSGTQGPQAATGRAGSSQGAGTAGREGSLHSRGTTLKPRQHTYTFCLERVDAGALKGTWFTVGVRVGDYSQ